MLRDRLVVGIRDLALSEKMQTKAGLTLERAKTLIRQKKATKEDTREMQGEGEAILNRLGQGGNSQGSYGLRSRQV